MNTLLPLEHIRMIGSQLVPDGFTAIAETQLHGNRPVLWVGVEYGSHRVTRAAGDDLDIRSRWSEDVPKAVAVAYLQAAQSVLMNLLPEGVKP